jgi:hypothetical protein
MTIYSIDEKRENNQKGEKMFTHSKDRVVRRDKIECLVMSGGDIERLPIATFEVFVLKTRIFVFSSVDIFTKNFVGILDRNLKIYLYY